MLDITDTAGQEDYAQMRDELLVDGDGFIIIYSITDPASFEEVQTLYDSILKVKNKSESIPCILAGNKIDLEDESRAVLKEQGEEQAKKMGKYCKFYETSAKAEPPVNVKTLFEEIVRLINNKDGNVEEQQEDMSQVGPQKVVPTQQPKENNKQQKKNKKKKCLIL
jgi:small GTP-binding protein